MRFSGRILIPNPFLNPAPLPRLRRRIRNKSRNRIRIGSEVWGGTLEMRLAGRKRYLAAFCIFPPQHLVAVRLADTTAVCLRRSGFRLR